MPRDSNLKVEMFLLFPGFLSLFFASGLLSVHEVILGLQKKADAGCSQGRILAIPLILLLQLLLDGHWLLRERELFCCPVGIFEPVA